MNFIYPANQVLIINICFPEAAHPIYISFSMLTNGRKLLETSKGSKDQIYVFAGMRTVSILWIIGKHAFTIHQTLPMTSLTPRVNITAVLEGIERKAIVFFSKK